MPRDVSYDYACDLCYDEVTKSGPGCDQPPKGWVGITVLNKSLEEHAKLPDRFICEDCTEKIASQCKKFMRVREKGSK